MRLMKWAAAAAVLSGVCLLVFTHRGASWRIQPAAMLAAGALVSVALPMVRSNFFPSAKDCAEEYAFHEKRLEAWIEQQISGAFGADACRRIMAAPGGFRKDADAFCRSLLESGAAGQDAELRFAVLMTLGRFYEKSGDPGRSNRYLSEALAIRPNHFIASFRLAMNHEWNGALAEAAESYGNALRDPDGLSRGMKKLAALELDRVRARIGNESS